MHRVSITTRGIHQSIAKRMTDPEWVSAYTQAFNNLNSEFYDPWWVSVILQSDKRNPLTIFDAAIFIEVYTAIHNGQIAHAAIPIGKQPSRDKADKLNNANLPNGPYRNQWIKPNEQRPINVIFTSWFAGGNAFTDGEIAYTGELPFFLTKNGDNQTVWLSSQSFNLEVGYCRSDQTWYGLAQARNLVRWPYGYDELVFMSVIDTDLWCTSLPPIDSHTPQTIEEWAGLPKQQLKLFEDVA